MDAARAPMRTLFFEGPLLVESARIATGATGPEADIQQGRAPIACQEEADVRFRSPCRSGQRTGATRDRSVKRLNSQGRSIVRRRTPARTVWQLPLHQPDARYGNGTPEVLDRIVDAQNNTGLVYRRAINRIMRESRTIPEGNG